MTQEAAKKERVAKVIEVLNKARSMELYAVHQYMNQHYNLDDLDYGEFASKIKLIAIDEQGRINLSIKKASRNWAASRTASCLPRSRKGRRLWMYSPST